MRIKNSFALAALMVAASLSAQNAPATTAPRPTSPQPRVFVPTASRVPVPGMQRRVVAKPKPELQQIATPVSTVVSPRPRPEPELEVPAAAPVTVQGSGQMAVDFRNGQLSIVADDAELGKVLHQIAEETGASVEVAPEISNERVIAHLGPGPAAEIVSTLLSSPRIDFIMMGSEDQNSIKRLIVSRRASFVKELPQLAPAAPSASEPESAATEAQPEPRGADQSAPEPAQEEPPQ